MISAWLVISLRENSVSLTELNLLIGFKSVKLPSDKAVIEWIHISGDERTTPISVNTEFLKVFLPLRWEELKPMNGVLESWNVLIWNTERLQDFILSG